MSDSIQHKLGRVRPPRVNITYDVETGGAIEKKELPLVVGIMADLAGKTKLPFVKDRKFVEIDRDNYNEVMEKITPTLAFQVDNRLEEGEEAEEAKEGEAAKEGKKAKAGEEAKADEEAKEEKEPSLLNVALEFKHVDDFRPEKLIHQIEPLKKLYEARQRLNDLVGKLDGNDNLDNLLQDIAANTEKQQEIRDASKTDEEGAENG